MTTDEQTVMGENGNEQFSFWQILERWGFGLHLHSKFWALMSSSELHVNEQLYPSYTGKGASCAWASFLKWDVTCYSVIMNSYRKEKTINANQEKVLKSRKDENIPDFSLMQQSSGTYSSLEQQMENYGVNPSVQNPPLCTQTKEQKPSRGSQSPFNCRFYTPRFLIPNPCFCSVVGILQGYRKRSSKYIFYEPNC